MTVLAQNKQDMRETPLKLPTVLIKGEYSKQTTPVASFTANASGLHDRHGNMREWIEDCWHDNHDGAPADGSA